MPAKQVSSSAAVSESDPESLPPLAERVNRVARACLAYAAAARVQHFRYCPRASEAFANTTLDAALSQLESKCEALGKAPVCQSLAFELLATFSSLAHCPPCQNRRQQESIAKQVHAALLELR